MRNQRYPHDEEALDLVRKFEEHITWHARIKENYVVLLAYVEAAAKGGDCTAQAVLAVAAGGVQ